MCVCGVGGGVGGGHQGYDVYCKRSFVRPFKTEMQRPCEKSKRTKLPTKQSKRKNEKRDPLSVGFYKLKINAAVHSKILIKKKKFQNKPIKQMEQQYI